jgi:hypothetical protein
MPDSLFDLGPPGALPPQDQRLVDAYVRCGRGLDDLPYTPECDALLAELARSGDARPPAQLLRRLTNLRKAKKLPTLGRTPSPPIKVSPDEEAFIVREVARLVGSLGQRDQLPYSTRMDELVASFHAFSGRNLTPHDVWRLVAKLAK